MLKKIKASYYRYKKALELSMPVPRYLFIKLESKTLTNEILLAAFNETVSEDIIQINKTLEKCLLGMKKITDIKKDIKSLKAEIKQLKKVDSDLNLKINEFQEIIRNTDTDKLQEELTNAIDKIQREFNAGNNMLQKRIVRNVELCERMQQLANSSRNVVRGC